MPGFYTRQACLLAFRQGERLLIQKEL